MKYQSVEASGVYVTEKGTRLTIEDENPTKGFRKSYASITLSSSYLVWLTPMNIWHALALSDSMSLDLGRIRLPMKENRIDEGNNRKK